MPAFHSILSTPWRASSQKPNEIFHEWPEDGNQAIIVVPAQIREELVAMQNWLHEKYMAHEQLLAEAAKIERFFEIKRLL